MRRVPDVTVTKVDALVNGTKEIRSRIPELHLTISEWFQNVGLEAVNVDCALPNGKMIYLDMSGKASAPGSRYGIWILLY